MRTPNFFWACYAIIKNQKEEILFQKRTNTWFRDWEYQLPAWHIEWNETTKQAMSRELKEELWIEVVEQDLEIQHISHRVSADRVYFDVYIEVKKYSWNLKIAEPDKCSSLDFIDINNIKQNHLFSYDLEVIKKIKKSEKFSEA